VPKGAFEKAKVNFLVHSIVFETFVGNQFCLRDAGWVGQIHTFHTQAMCKMKVVVPMERIPAPSTFSSKHKGTLCRNRTLQPTAQLA